MFNVSLFRIWNQSLVHSYSRKKEPQNLWICYIPWQWKIEVTNRRLLISWLWDGEIFLHNLSLPNAFPRGRKENQCESDAVWDRLHRPLRRKGNQVAPGGHEGQGQVFSPLNYRRNTVPLTPWFKPSETHFGLQISRTVRKYFLLLFSFTKFIKICYSNNRKLIQLISTVSINVHNRSKNTDCRRIYNFFKMIIW